MATKKNSFLFPFYNFFENLCRFFMYVNFQFSRNRCLPSAAALSYTSLLALVPLLSIAFAMLSSFHVLKNIQNSMLNYIFNHFFLESQGIIQQYLEEFISNIQHLDVVGLAVLVSSMLLVFTTIEKTFNIIWSVDTPRPFIQRVLSFWALITLGPLIAGIGINILFSFIIEFSHYDYILKDPLIQFSSFVLPFFILSIVFTILYFIIPNYSVMLSHAVIGGFFTAFLLEICRHLFIAYITHMSSYQFVYKTLSVLPLFIVWMYAFWALVLYGAQIVATLPDWSNIPSRKFLDTPSTSRAFWDGIRVLEALYKTSENTGLLRYEIIERIKIGGVRIEKLLHKFHKGKIIEQSREGYWFLVGNQQKIKLYEIYETLGYGIKNLEELKDDHLPWKKEGLALLKKLQEKEASCLTMTLGDLFGPKNT